MNTEYSLSDSYNGSGPQQSVEMFAEKHIGGNPVMALGLIVVLTLIIVWLVFIKAKETFNPTRNLRDQDSDQFGFGKRENMEPNRGQSAFAQQVQSGGVHTSASAQAVLSSAEFDCNNRKAAGDDAWAWMTGASKSEGMTSQKPQNDNDFSKVLAGQ